MASQITLADGSKATVDTGNYADLARLQISLQQAKYGAAYTVDEQAATLQAFKVAAGLPPVYNVIPGTSTATFDDAAITLQKQVDDNPVVKISNAIEHPGQTITAAVDTIKTGVAHAAAFVEAAGPTLKIGLVVAGIFGVAAIFYFSHRLAKDLT